MGTLPVFLGKILSTYQNHGMAQSPPHPSAGSALGRQVGCWRGSGKSWSLELSWINDTWPHNPFLPFFPAHHHPQSSCRRPQCLEWGKRAPSQTPKTSMWVWRKHGTGGLLHFCHKSASSCCSWPLQVRRHTMTPGLTTFCTAVLWAPFLVFRSLITNLDTAYRVHALCSSTSGQLAFINCMLFILK